MHQLRASPKIWNQIKNDPELNLLRPKYDIFDAATSIRDLLPLMGYKFRRYNESEWENNPEAFLIDIKDKLMQEIINQSMDPDPRKRPTAEQIVKKLYDAGV